MIRAVPRVALWPGVTVWIILNAIAFGWALDLAYWNHRFAVESQPVEGTVTDKHVSVRHGRGGPLYIYDVSYCYRVDDFGFSTTKSVLPSTWRSVSVGKGLPLRYLETDPKISRIDFDNENHLTALHAEIPFIIGMVFLVGGASSITYFFWRNKFHARLLQQGVSCLGQVESLESEQVGRNNVQWYLVFTFTDNRGKQIRGRTWGINPNHVELWRDGGDIRVYFDAANSHLFTVDLGAAD